VVDAVDRRAVDHQHAGPVRKQIRAPGKGAFGNDALAGHGLRNAGSGLVFGDVALLQPHHDHFRHAGLVERLDLGRSDRGALLEHQGSLTERMYGDPANRLGRTGRTELHAASSFSFGGRRNCAVISAMIATAISDGETAPTLSPIGAWTRAMSTSPA